MSEIIKKCKIHGDLNGNECSKEKSKGKVYIYCSHCINDRNALKNFNNKPKKCVKHGALEEKDIKRYNNSKGYPTAQCRKCHRETASAARNKDRTKANIWGKMDRKNYPEKYRKWAREVHAKNPEKKMFAYLKRVYKLTKEEYYRMNEDQQYCCLICGQKEKRRTRSKKEVEPRLCIDHCHKTGIVRGLLCHDCNTGLGKFKDSMELLFKAAAYLDRFEED